MHAKPRNTRHESTPSPDGQRQFSTASHSWGDNHGRRKTALFRLYGYRGVLQHIRTKTVDRGPTPSSCEIDTEPSLDDVADSVLDELRDRGFDLIAAGRSG